jgi:hypothetical protein
MHLLAWFFSSLPTRELYRVSTFQHVYFAPPSLSCVGLWIFFFDGKPASLERHLYGYYEMRRIALNLSRNSEILAAASPQRQQQTACNLQSGLLRKVRTRTQAAADGRSARTMRAQAQHIHICMQETANHPLVHSFSLREERQRLGNSFRLASFLEHQACPASVYFRVLRGVDSLHGRTRIDRTTRNNRHCLRRLSMIVGIDSGNTFCFGWMPSVPKDCSSAYPGPSSDRPAFHIRRSCTISGIGKSAFMHSTCTRNGAMY